MQPGDVTCSVSQPDVMMPQPYDPPQADGNWPMFEDFVRELGWEMYERHLLERLKEDERRRVRQEQEAQIAALENKLRKFCEIPPYRCQFNRHIGWINYLKDLLEVKRMKRCSIRKAKAARARHAETVSTRRSAEIARLRPAIVESVSLPAESTLPPSLAVVEDAIEESADVPPDNTFPTTANLEQSFVPLGTGLLEQPVPGIVDDDAPSAATDTTTSTPEKLEQSINPLETGLLGKQDPRIADDDAPIAVDDTAAATTEKLEKLLVPSGTGSPVFRAEDVDDASLVANTTVSEGESSEESGLCSECSEECPVCWDLVFGVSGIVLRGAKEDEASAATDAAAFTVPKSESRRGIPLHQDGEEQQSQVLEDMMDFEQSTVQEEQTAVLAESESMEWDESALQTTILDYDFGDPFLAATRPQLPLQSTNKDELDVKAMSDEDFVNWIGTIDVTPTTFDNAAPIGRSIYDPATDPFTQFLEDTNATAAPVSDEAFDFNNYALGEEASATVLEPALFPGIFDSIADRCAPWSGLQDGFGDFGHGEKAQPNTLESTLFPDVLQDESNTIALADPQQFATGSNNVGERAMPEMTTNGRPMAIPKRKGVKNAAPSTNQFAFGNGNAGEGASSLDFNPGPPPPAVAAWSAKGAPLIAQPFTSGSDSIGDAADEVEFDDDTALSVLSAMRRVRDIPAVQPVAASGSRSGEAFDFGGAPRIVSLQDFSTTDADVCSHPYESYSGDGREEAQEVTLNARSEGGQDDDDSVGDDMAMLAEDIDNPDADGVDPFSDDDLADFLFSDDGVEDEGGEEEDPVAIDDSGSEVFTLHDREDEDEEDPLPICDSGSELSEPDEDMLAKIEADQILEYEKSANMRVEEDKERLKPQKKRREAPEVTLGVIALAHGFGARLQQQGQAPAPH